MPKLHEKAIICLDPDEVAIMLDNIETYENQLTGKKARFHALSWHRNPGVGMCRS